MFKISLHQANKDKPRAQKCRHFCFSFDLHNYCPTCREAGTGDGPCVTFETPCQICTSFTDEQLKKIQHRKRYLKKQKAETSSKDDELDLLGEGDGDSFTGSNADLESAASPSRLQGPVPEPNSVSCDGQLNSGSLHQQTRRNSLSRNVCSPVEDHDLVPSLPYNIESQAHSRMPECDGRPTVQVQPSAVNRMVSASAGVQTDLPEVVHTSCRLICHSPEPQTSTVRISCPRPKGLGHRCSKHKLDQPHGLCLPSYGSPSQGDPKDQAMSLPDYRNSPRLARDALVLGPSAALNRDRTTTPSVNDPTQTVPQVCVPLQPSAAEPPCLVSRSGQLQEQDFSVEVAERIAAPQRSSTRTIYKSKWALFEKWCR